MATSKRVVSVSVKRPKRDREQKIRTVLNESTVASVASGEAMLERLGTCDFCGAQSVPLVSRLTADADQRVCEVCHADPRVPTMPAPPPVTDGIGVIRLDPALLDMLRGYVETIRKVYPDVWDVPTWDAPWECIPPGIPGLEAAHLRDVKVAAEFCHAIGGIAGAAAMMDLTPCMLIDNLRL